MTTTRLAPLRRTKELELFVELQFDVAALQEHEPFGVDSEIDGACRPILGTERIAGAFAWSYYLPKPTAQYLIDAETQWNRRHVLGLQIRTNDGEQYVGHEFVEGNGEIIDQMSLAARERWHELCTSDREIQAVDSLEWHFELRTQSISEFGEVQIIAEVVMD